MRSIGILAVLFSVGCKSDQEILVPDQSYVGVDSPPPEINPVQTDRILQVESPAVDILFVIDNSCSMAEEQAQLAANFPLFLEYFLGSGLDYHIGVLSTDMNSGLDTGRLRSADGYRYIDSDTPHPEQVFRSMATMGITGWWEERGRDAVYTNIDIRRDDPANEGFYRSTAALDIVFVSDEDDSSELLSRDEFLAWLNNLKFTEDMVAAHALVGPDLGYGDTCTDAEEIGKDYLRLASATGGQTFSICESNWGPMLDRLGLQTSGLRKEYFLTKVPIYESLVVQVVTPSTGATLNFEVCRAGEEVEDTSCEVVFNPVRNSIAFLEYLPDPLAEIHATYNIKENFSSEGLSGSPGATD